MARIAKRKRCPFCARTDTFVECMDFGAFAVVCNVCGARGPEGAGDGCDADADNQAGHRNATREWNRRKRPILTEAVQ